MAVTVKWVEYNGTVDDAGQGSALVSTINFGSTDSADLTPASYPIAAGSNSYIKYLKLQFSGSFTKIDNLKLWKSSGNYKTGETIKFSGSYTKSGAPVQTDIPDVGGKAVPNIPTSSPADANVAYTKWGTDDHTTTAASLPTPSQSESSPGYYSGSRSSMMAFQLQTTSSTPAGAVNEKTISVTFDRQ